MYQVSQIPQPPFALSSETARTLRQLSSAIEAHNKSCDKLTNEAAAMRAVAASDWTADADALAAQLRASKRALLIEAISLRERADALYGQIMAVDKPAAADATYEAWQEVVADVRAQLYAIGFESGELFEHTVLAIHPAVKAARIDRDTTRGYDNQANAQKNRAELAKLRTQLAEYRERAVAGL